MTGMIRLAVACAAVLAVTGAGAAYAATPPSTVTVCAKEDDGKLELKGAKGCKKKETEFVLATAATVSSLEARIALLETKIAALETANADLQTRFAGVSRDGSTLKFSGMNLQLVNGIGATGTANSLGNLIVGYNEGSHDRSGSHYVVVGTQNSWTTWGGIVAGVQNVASGPYATVTGGTFNRSQGYVSAVTGGDVNTASADKSVVVGGRDNMATPPAQFSVVSGGGGNTAAGAYATVTGGLDNVASGQAATVAGGGENQATGRISLVAGGARGTASGEGAVVLGGFGSSTSAAFSAVGVLLSGV